MASATATTTKVNGATDCSKLECNGRAYVNGYSKGSVDIAYGHSNGAASQNGVLPGQAPRRADKATASSKRSQTNPSVNPITLASTILKSCPMYDTIAILIFLLQLPPMVLTLVQFLFASLT